MISFGGSQKGDLVWLLEGGNCQNNLSLCGRGLTWQETLVCQISVWEGWPWGVEPLMRCFCSPSLSVPLLPCFSPVSLITLECRLAWDWQVSLPSGVHYHRWHWFVLFSVSLPPSLSVAMFHVPGSVSSCFLWLFWSSLYTITRSFFLCCILTLDSVPKAIR